MRILTLTLLLVTLVAGNVAHAAQLLATRLWPSPDYTRVTLEAAAPLVHTHFMLDQPARLVVDLEDTRTGPAFEPLIRADYSADPYIRAIRVAPNRPGVVRLVIDLKAAVRPELFTLPPQANYSHRLVIDLHAKTPVADPLGDFVARRDEAAPAKPELSKPELAKSEFLRPDPAKPDSTRADSPKLDAYRPAPEAPRKDAVAKSEPAGKPEAGKPAAPRYDRLVTIAIDAGHGGEDPGALGAAGSREKDITLALAKKLKARFDAEPNMRGVLTRNGDYFVPLAQRVVKARAAEADLFMSIHADAFVKPHARGSSVFALSEGSATSVAARWLAKKENDADLIGGINIDVKDQHLKRTLIDLTQTATIEHSMKLGRAVLKQVGGVNTLHKHHVEQAGFAVLKAPDIPSILVETAFISNPEEERKLNDEAYQNQLVDAIFDGVRDYLAKHPPAAPARLTRNP